MANISLNTKLAEFLRLCEQENACEEALVWMREHEKVEETLAAYCADDDADEAWAYWIFCRLLQQLDRDVQLLLANKIHNPMRAFHVCDRFGEFPALEVRFRDKLPNARRNR